MHDLLADMETLLRRGVVIREIKASAIGNVGVVWAPRRNSRNKRTTTRPTLEEALAAVVAETERAALPRGAHCAA